MDSNYLLEAKRVREKYTKYQKDIEKIFCFSESISKDLVKYVLQVLKDDKNPEIGKVLVEVAFQQHATMLTILKCLVKVLYVVKHITKYKYGDYHQLKKNIDEALDKIGGNKAEIAKKKYAILLEKFDSDKNSPELLLPKGIKPEAINEIRDTINKKYIRFV